MSIRSRRRKINEIDKNAWKMFQTMLLTFS